MESGSSLEAVLEAKLTLYINRWRDICLSTEPADRPSCETALTEIYRRLSLPRPEFVWTGSPISMALAGAILCDGEFDADGPEKLGGPILQRIETLLQPVPEHAADPYFRVRRELSAALPFSASRVGWSQHWDEEDEEIPTFGRPYVRAPLGPSTEPRAWEIVWEAVTDSVWAGVRTAVSCVTGKSLSVDRVRTLKGKLGSSAREALGHCAFGQHDADLLGAMDFLRNELGYVAETEASRPLLDQARAGGWFLAHERYCFISERPKLVTLDHDQLPHSDIGPAALYRDGWPVYSIHGARVPEWIVLRSEEIAIRAIADEPDVERRRTMIGLYRHGEEVSGAVAFLRDAGGTVVDRDQRFGTLYRLNFPDAEAICVVEVINRTIEPDGFFNIYRLSVPPHCRTAHEAVAWTFGLTPEEYHPEIET